MPASMPLPRADEERFWRGVEAAGRFFMNEAEVHKALEERSTPVLVGVPMSSTPASVVDAFRTTLDLFESGLDLMRQNLRRANPAATDDEIDRRLGEWLRQRPGAAAGDCPGRSVDVHTRLS